MRGAALVVAGLAGLATAQEPAPDEALGRAQARLRQAAGGVAAVALAEAWRSPVMVFTERAEPDDSGVLARAETAERELRIVLERFQQAIMDALPAGDRVPIVPGIVVLTRRATAASHFGPRPRYVGHNAAVSRGPLLVVAANPWGDGMTEPPLSYGEDCVLHAWRAAVGAAESPNLERASALLAGLQAWCREPLGPFRTVRLGLAPVHGSIDHARQQVATWGDERAARDVLAARAPRAHAGVVARKDRLAVRLGLVDLLERASWELPREWPDTDDPQTLAAARAKLRRELLPWYAMAFVDFCQQHHDGVHRRALAVFLRWHVTGRAPDGAGGWPAGDSPEARGIALRLAFAPTPLDAVQRDFDAWVGLDPVGGPPTRDDATDRQVRRLRHVLRFGSGLAGVDFDATTAGPVCVFRERAPVARLDDVDGRVQVAVALLRTQLAALVELLGLPAPARAALPGVAVVALHSPEARERFRQAHGLPVTDDDAGAWLDREVGVLVVWDPTSDDERIMDRDGWEVLASAVPDLVREHVGRSLPGYDCHWSVYGRGAGVLTDFGLDAWLRGKGPWPGPDDDPAPPGSVAEARRSIVEWRDPRSARLRLAQHDEEEARVVARARRSPSIQVPLRAVLAELDWPDPPDEAAPASVEQMADLALGEHTCYLTATYARAFIGFCHEWRDGAYRAGLARYVRWAWGTEPGHPVPNRDGAPQAARERRLCEYLGVESMDALEREFWEWLSP